MTSRSNDPGDQGEGAPDLVEPWNLVADGYTSVIMPMSEYFARQALRLASLPSPAQIVDVATGPGPLALMAAAAGVSVHAIDFSPGMVSNLRRRAEQQGIELADIRVGDGQNLPYDDNQFDGAFSLLGLIFFPDREAGFQELRRVLSPGRLAVVSSMATLSKPLYAGMESLQSVLPELDYPTGELPLADANQLVDEMSAAGFVEVNIHTIQYSEMTGSVADLWEKLQRGMAFITVLQHNLGEERWTEVSQAVINRLHAKLGDGPIQETYTNHFGVGRK